MAMNAYATDHAPVREANELLQEYEILSTTLAAVKRNRIELDKKGRSLRPLFIQAADLILVKIEADLAIVEQMLRHMQIEIGPKPGSIARERLNAAVNERICAYVSAIFSKK